MLDNKKILAIVPARGGSKGLPGKNLKKFRGFSLVANVGNGSSVPDAIPIVGGLVVQVLRGGVSVGQSTLTRFYSAHTFVLPVVAVVLMLTHFVMIRKQGISGPL